MPILHLSILVLASIVETAKSELQFRSIRYTLVSEKQFPFVVSILDANFTHGCTGSLVTLSRVLTAAHCHVEPLLKYVAAGSVNIYKDRRNLYSAYQLRKIIGNYTHPKYVYGFHPEEDFLVYALDTPFLETEHVSTIGIATDPLEDQQKCIALGFGGSERRSEKTTDGKLRYANLEVKNELCDRNKMPTVYCVKGNRQSRHRDDSGGPLIKSEELPYRLYGVFSAGNSVDQLGMYGNAVTNRKWILTAIHDRQMKKAKSSGLVFSSHMNTILMLWILSEH